LIQGRKKRRVEMRFTHKSGVRPWGTRFVCDRLLGGSNPSPRVSSMGGYKVKNHVWGKKKKRKKGVPMESGE